jgi:hypothetical protein
MAEPTPGIERRPSMGRERKPSMSAPLSDLQGPVGPGFSRPKHKRTVTGFGAADIKAVEASIPEPQRAAYVHFPRLEEIFLTKASGGKISYVRSIAYQWQHTNPRLKAPKPFTTPEEFEVCLDHELEIRSQI